MDLLAYWNMTCRRGHAQQDPHTPWQEVKTGQGPAPGAGLVARSATTTRRGHHAHARLWLHPTPAMGHPGGETRGLRHFGWAQTWWMMTHCRAGQVLCFAGLHQQAQRWLRRWTACSPYRMQVRAHVEDHAREAVVLGGLTLEGVQLEAPDSVQPEVLPRPLVLRRYHSQIDRRRSHGRQRSHPKETIVLMSRKSPGLGTRTSLATLPVCEDAVARMLIAANTSLHHGCNSRTHARAKSWTASSRLCQGCCTTFSTLLASSWQPPVQVQVLVRQG